MAKDALTPTGIKKNHKKGIAAAHKARLREEAAVRQAEHNKLTPQQKLAKLDAGGFRAERERARLMKQIEQGAQK